MRTIRLWHGAVVEMDCCRLCGIGSGVTVYPDLVWVHAERELVDDLCADCRRRLARIEPAAVNASRRG